MASTREAKTLSVRARKGLTEFWRNNSAAPRGSVSFNPSLAIIFESNVSLRLTLYLQKDAMNILSHRLFFGTYGPFSDEVLKEELNTFGTVLDYVRHKGRTYLFVWPLLLLLWLVGH